MRIRIRKWTEAKKIYRESQAGFTGKRDTRDQISILNSIIGNKLENTSGRICVAFIDFKTAFDIVNIEILLEKLEKLGMKGYILEMIKSIYIQKPGMK